MNTREKTSEELLATSDEEIQQQIQNDPDVAPKLDADFFENATILEPEVTAWFKDRYGKRYQVYMMAALREYMETHAV
jgi:uncharacterized protein (DUF4415 family)